MAITIASNIASMQAQRRLGQSTSTLERVSERLSSGMRINRASDDAAGLAVSLTLNANARVYSRSILNVNDYTSALQIASGAMSEVSNVLTRILELSSQAANGTFNTTQREALHTEANALRKEINRITETTKFQGRNLLDGTFTNSLAQVGGADASSNIFVNIGNVLGTLRADGSFNSVTSFSSLFGTSGSAIAIGDFNGDGIDDYASAGTTVDGILVRTGNGDGTFSSGITYLAGAASGPIRMISADLNGDGFADIISTRNNHGSGTEGVEILMNNGDGSFRYASNTNFGFTASGNTALGDVDGDGDLDIVVGGTGQNHYGVIKNNGNGTFSNAGTYGGGTQYRFNKLADVNGDGKLDLITALNSNRISIGFGNGDGTFASSGTYNATNGTHRDIDMADFNGDGILDIITGGATQVSMFLGNSDGSFQAEQLVATADMNSVILGDFNDDGVSDIAFQGAGYFSVSLNNGNGTFRSSTSQALAGGGGSIGLGDFNQDGIKDFLVAVSSQNIQYLQGSGVTGVAEVDLTTIRNARNAITRISNTISNLSGSTGVLGATQSRLDIARSNLTTLRDNYLAADSRIKDADMAEESAHYIRQNILQQVGASILAQANQAPSLALQLLRGS